MDRSRKQRLKLRKRTMNFGTWSIQGLRGKMEQIIREIDNMDIDIVTLTETKKKSKGTEILDKYIHIFSGVEKEKRAH